MTPIRIIAEIRNVDDFGTSTHYQGLDVELAENDELLNVTVWASGTILGAIAFDEPERPPSWLQRLRRWLHR